MKDYLIPMSKNGSDNFMNGRTDKMVNFRFQFPLQTRNDTHIRQIE